MPAAPRGSQGKASALVSYFSDWQQKLRTPAGRKRRVGERKWKVKRRNSTRGYFRPEIRNTKVMWHEDLIQEGQGFTQSETGHKNEKPDVNSTRGWFPIRLTRARPHSSWALSPEPTLGGEHSPQQQVHVTARSQETRKPCLPQDVRALQCQFLLTGFLHKREEMWPLICDTGNCSVGSRSSPEA